MSININRIKDQSTCLDFSPMHSLIQVSNKIQSSLVSTLFVKIRVQRAKNKLHGRTSSFSVNPRIKIYYGVNDSKNDKDIE